MTHNFCGFFKLKSPEEIKLFFPSSKTDKLEKATVTMRKISHRAKTGVWVDLNKVYSFIETGRTTRSFDRHFEGTVVHRKILRRIHKMDVKKEGLRSTVKTHARFLSEFAKAPLTVGSAVPSSKFLAKAAVKHIPKDLNAYPRTILEVGPGTGAFTQKILQRMNPRDHLDIVEFSPEFAAKLRKKYENVSTVTVHESCILKFKSKKKYTHIVSGLPFNSFPSDMVQNIFEKYASLAKKGTTISYFEYLLLPEIRKHFSPDLRRVLAIKEQFYNVHGTSKDRVLRNLPPAEVINHEVL